MVNDMKIGIIFAMEEELYALKKNLNIEKEFNLFDLKFYEATIENLKCILVQSGIGKVNSQVEAPYVEIVLEAAIHHRVGIT